MISSANWDKSAPVNFLTNKIARARSFFMIHIQNFTLRVETLMSFQDL